MGETQQVKELVHFTAKWCQPCRAMEPIIAEFVNENPDIKYVKVDVDEDKKLFDFYHKQYSVMSVPTFLGMVDGKVIDGHVGATNKFVLKSLLG